MKFLAKEGLRPNGRLLFRALLAFSILLLGTLPVAAQTDLTGFWILRVPTGDGNYRESFFDLKQAGEKVTGKVLMGSREAPISDGTFSNGKLHLVVTLRFQDQERSMNYDGTMDGGKISMTVQFPGRDPMLGIAERSTPAAALPPLRLPLPALHDVPDNGPARTPPMGWNSWNKFAGKVDDAAVRGMADAMAATGMKDVGYTYINIDDTWEGPRDAQGNITTNRKFPDMKALADYVHSKGLKIGIYSSPGPKTCAGYEGSYGHEDQDAKTYAAWGFDYLKYDWCSAGRIYKDSRYASRLPENGRCAACHRPPHRFQPVPVWAGRRLEVGCQSGRQSLAHHRGYQRSLAKHGQDRLLAIRYRFLWAGRPLERSRHAGNRQRWDDRRRIPHPHEPVVAAGCAATGGQRFAVDERGDKVDSDEHGSYRHRPGP